MQEKGFRKLKTDGGRWFCRGVRWKATEGVRDRLQEVNVTPPESETDDRPLY